MATRIGDIDDPEVRAAYRLVKAYTSSSYIGITAWARILAYLARRIGCQALLKEIL